MSVVGSKATSVSSSWSTAEDFFTFLGEGASVFDVTGLVTEGPHPVSRTHDLNCTQLSLEKGSSSRSSCARGSSVESAHRESSQEPQGRLASQGVVKGLPHSRLKANPSDHTLNRVQRGDLGVGGQETSGRHTPGLQNQTGLAA